MRLYFRYIFASIFSPFLLIICSLTAMVWLTQTLRMLDLVVTKGISLSIVLWLSVLLLPSLVFMILPAGLFIATIYVYYRMVVNHELFVWRSAGLSNMQLAAPAAFLATCVVLTAYFLALYLSPGAYHRFKEQQTFIRDHYASLLLQDNTFSSPMPGLTVFIRAHQEKGKLEGIMIHDSRLPGKDITLTAQTGRIEQQEGRTVFALEHGTRQEYDRERQRLQMLYFDNYPMDISLYTQAISERKRMPEEYGMRELFSAQTTEEDPIRLAKLKAEGHQRLTWPWYNLLLPLIGVLALLHMPYNRRGYLPYIAGVSVMGTVVMMGGIMAHSLVLSHPILWPLMYGFILIMGGVMGLLVRHRILERLQ